MNEDPKGDPEVMADLARRQSELLDEIARERGAGGLLAVGYSLAWVLGSITPIDAIPALAEGLLQQVADGAAEAGHDIPVICERLAEDRGAVH